MDIEKEIKKIKKWNLIVHILLIILGLLGMMIWMIPNISHKDILMIAVPMTGAYIVMIVLHYCMNRLK